MDVQMTPLTCEKIEFFSSLCARIFFMIWASVFGQQSFSGFPAISEDIRNTKLKITFLSYEWFQVIHNIIRTSYSTLHRLWSTGERCFELEIKCMLCVGIIIIHRLSKWNILIADESNNCFVFISVILSLSKARKNKKNTSLRSWEPLPGESMKMPGVERCCNLNFKAMIQPWQQQEIRGVALVRLGYLSSKLELFRFICTESQDSFLNR